MKTFISACASVITLAACTNAAPVKTADAKPDPRQGAEVQDVCFQQQIRNWRENDHHSVIIEKGVREEYKLELIGTCQPEDAFLSIGLISRVGGGSCLRSGDKLVTDARYNDGSCVIHRIYKWNKDAGKMPAASAAPAQ